MSASIAHITMLKRQQEIRNWVGEKRRKEAATLETHDRNGNGHTGSRSRSSEIALKTVSQYRKVQLILTALIFVTLFISNGKYHNIIICYFESWKFLSCTRLGLANHMAAPCQ